jgi:hypothetical protein
LARTLVQRDAEIHKIAKRTALMRVSAGDKIPQ